MNSRKSATPVSAKLSLELLPFGFWFRCHLVMPDGSSKLSSSSHCPAARTPSWLRGLVVSTPALPLSSTLNTGTNLLLFLSSGPTESMLLPSLSLPISICRLVKVCDVLGSVCLVRCRRRGTCSSCPAEFRNRSLPPKRLRSPSTRILPSTQSRSSEATPEG